MDSVHTIVSCLKSWRTGLGILSPKSITTERRRRLRRRFTVGHTGLHCNSPASQTQFGLFLLFTKYSSILLSSLRNQLPRNFDLATFPLSQPAHEPPNMTSRKTQQEIDKTFKKVAEGIQAFEGIYEKIKSTTNAAQRDKLEDNLKREIKKLQRFRDQIKSWAAGNEVKDKSPLLEQRRAIETVG